jgi:spore coat polysaccharide biosynthesis protein SpsF
MGSERLPRKSLVPVYGDLPLLRMVLLRLSECHGPVLNILATSSNADCDPLEEMAHSLGWDVVRGDEEDVLSRFALVCEKYHPGAVVRVCADNPFICPGEIDKLIDFFEREKPDYAENKSGLCGLPDGFGAEMMTATVIEKIDRVAVEPAHREHVVDYLLDNPEDFDIRTLKAEHELDCPEIKLDIDTREDLEKMRCLCALLDDERAPCWGPEEIIEAYFRMKEDAPDEK